MKALKVILFGLLGLAGIYLILALFAPSKIHVERTMVINADANIVHGQINDLKNWKKWSFWDNIDPNMKSTFEGSESGVGAIHKWESENDSVGKGSLTITQSEPGKFVETKLAFEGMGESMGGWRIKDTTGGVAVTSYMDMAPPFLFRPMCLFMDMEKMLGEDFMKSLAGLKTLAESIKNEPPPAPVIEEGTMEATKVLTILDSCNSMKEIGPKLGALYGEMGAEATKAGAKQAGAVFAIYHKVTVMENGDMKFVLEAGVPVDKEMKSAGRVKYWVMPACNVVKAAHYGKYETTDRTHAAAHEWISSNNKQIIGSPWEVYVTDPGKEPDSNKWLTEIYYPIK